MLRAMVFALALGVAVASASAQSARVTQMRCEYRIDPTGIDVAAPRLSWQMAALDPTQRGLRQTAYEILAATTPDGLDPNTVDLWDSGRIVSDASTQIPYGGRPLASRTVVWWKVRIWDQNSRPSAWSQAGTWSMGLLSPADWTGQWIGRDETEELRRPDSAYWNLEKASWISSAGGDYQKSLDIPASPRMTSAVLAIGSQDAYELRVNGVHVQRSDRVSMANILQIAPYLHAGTNTLQAHVTRATGKTALVAGLKLSFDDGTTQWIATSADWGAEVLGPYGKPGLARYDDIGFHQEHYVPARYLRREFSVDKTVLRATAYVCGLGLFELHVNGAKVSDDVLMPALSQYTQRDYYRTFDVTNLVHDGDNAVGVILGNGRFWGPRPEIPTRTVSFGYPKLMFQLELEYADGTSSSVVSDGNWKLTADGPLGANNEYDGEEYDARREMTGWDVPGFDDHAWQPARIVAAPGGVLAAQMSEPMRVMQRRHPIAMTEPYPGIYIFDMGQNMVGWCRLNVQGRRGTPITLRYAERLTDQGRISVENLRVAQSTDVYILAGSGVETWEPRFTYHGFRYVQVEGLSRKPSLDALDGRVVYDAMEIAGQWSSSNDLLNQLHSNLVWGIRGNYRSMPTDCPQRDEREGWLGDRAQEQLGETYEFDVPAFYTKWLKDIADTQAPDGTIPSVAPAYWRIYKPDVTWPSALFYVAASMHRQYGDRRIIESLYPAMKKWMDMTTASVSPDGLISWANYGDWCMPPESPEVIHSTEPGRQTDRALLATAYFHGLCRKMSDFASILGKNDDAVAYATLAARVADGFNHKFFDANTALYSNGSQTSSVLPLAIGLVPADQRPRVVQALVDRIARDGNHLQTGVLGTAWLMRALSDNGRPDVAYTLATQRTYPSWGYMVDHGATTFWELWNGDTADPSMNSGNHVMLMGDLDTWLYEDLAGIRPDERQPGFKQVIFHPLVLGDLTWVSATHRGPYGTITSRWERRRDDFSMEVSVPPNSTATLDLPAADVATVMEHGGPADKAAGVRLEKFEDGRAIYSLSSGNYSFESTLP
jgi:alpha-L-rhamnosidase